MIGKEVGMCWWWGDTDRYGGVCMVLGEDRYGGVVCEGDMVWSMGFREAIGVVIVEKY